jgi:hypothetical protein
MIQIAIVNESTLITDADVQAIVAALQRQLDQDFTPIYSISAKLVFMPKGGRVWPGTWELVFADDSDQAGALGYHETTVNGDPIGFAFVKDTLAAGDSVSVTAGHELLEMLGDPDIQTAEIQDMADGSSTLRMKELCDACEDDSYGYAKVDPSTGKLFVLPSTGKPILVSDFVLPAYWNPDAPAGSAFDFRGHMTAPLQILPGGYMGVRTVPAADAWEQVTEMDATARVLGGKPPVRFNRRARRLMNRRTWRRSTR